jgi:hypothetical protein
MQEWDKRWPPIKTRWFCILSGPECHVPVLKLHTGGGEYMTASTVDGGGWAGQGGG